MFQKLLIIVFLFLFIGFTFAQTEERAIQKNNSDFIEVNDTRQGNLMQNSGFDFQYSSFADPEYVAQQKFVESMTSVYNWIALNSSDFINNCDANKDVLIFKIVDVINNAQERSNVCEKFDLEVKNCNPEQFCKNHQKGRLPLSPEMKLGLKKMGKDVSTLTIDDLSEELLLDICKNQLKLGFEKNNAYLDKTRESIKNQIPNFRNKCKELNEWNGNRTGPEIKLPDFYIPKAQQEQKNEWQESKSNENYNNDYEQKNESNLDIMPPEEIIDNTIIQDASEINEESEYKEDQINSEEQETSGESQESSGESQESSGESQEPSNIETKNFSVIQNNNLIGFFVLPEVRPRDNAVCGDGYCQPDLGENSYYCHDDCLPDNTSSMNPKDNYKKENYQEGYKEPMRNNMGPGMSPEMMCDLDDDELIELFAPNNESISDEDLDYKCKTQSSYKLSEINMMKLEQAKCLAKASLECVAKQKLVENCNVAKSNPENVAKFMVNNLCRQFGVKPIEHDLYNLADKWMASDPALAYELGDTVDIAISGKDKLNTLSYLFGNEDYSNKMKEKTENLKAIKERLKNADVNDLDTIKILEEQIDKFDNEANKYGSFFNFSRIFDIFN